MTADAEWRATWAEQRTIRAPEPGDQGYITTTWLRSMRKAPEFRRWSRHRFNDTMGQLVDRVLEHGYTSGAVSVAPDGWTILGWLVYTPMSKQTAAIHYAYVRAGERGKGVARSLASAACIDDTQRLLYTCHGPLARALATRYNARHVPLEEFLR